ncbi:hypothetical protein H7H37_00345 [Mycolicibacterium insubricum]|nr:hypothetical protein [Mycolicibacterium insubricum]
MVNAAFRARAADLRSAHDRFVAGEVELAALALPCDPSLPAVGSAAWPAG